jgi:hypothetical protein
MLSDLRVVDFGNGLTCERIGDECYLSNGVVTSAQILIIIRSIYHAHISDNMLLNASNFHSMRYTVEFNGRNAKSNRRYGHGRVLSEYTELYNCYRIFEIADDYSITIGGESTMTDIQRESKGITLLYEIALEVVNILRRHGVNTEAYYMTSHYVPYLNDRITGELFIDGHYASVTSVSSATEFVESLFRSRAKSARTLNVKRLSQ